jgi:predicted tellurium resistance membrane protein TerC
MFNVAHNPVTNRHIGGLGEIAWRVNAIALGPHLSLLKGVLCSPCWLVVMIGMALVADGLQQHIERGFIYAALVFAGAVEALNLLRARRRQACA